MMEISNRCFVLFYLSEKKIITIEVLLQQQLMSKVDISASEKEKSAHLSSIIKQKQKKQNKQIIPSYSQISHLPRLSEKQYQSIVSQYTTNYQSNNAIKNTRNFRQDISRVRYLDHIGEFIAYCIINKESGWGIFANDRFLVLDSHLKELKYYTEIPSELPLQRVEDLKGTAKEVIHLATVTKFNFLPMKNGIGQATISWIQQGTAKQWRITMGNRRIGHELSMLIQEVRNNEHLVKKQPKKVLKNKSPDNKINKVETPFISDLKKLEERQQKISESVLKGSKIRQSTTQPRDIKEQKIINIGSEIKITRFEPNEIQENSKQQQPQKNQQQNIIKHQSNQQKLLINLSQNQKQTEDNSQKNIINEKSPQIVSDERVEPTKQQAVIKPNSPTFQNERFMQLQQILSNRKSKLKSQSQKQQSYLQDKNQNLNQSKILVKKIQKITVDKFREIQDSKRYEVQKEQTNNLIVNTRRRQSQFAQDYNNYRQSLIQQRRKQGNYQDKNILQNQVNKPKRQSSSSKQSKGNNLSNNKSQDESWLSKWLMANTYNGYAEVYDQFLDHCLIKVKKLTNAFEDWHLFHKTAKQYGFQEDNIQFRYVFLSQNCNKQQFFSKQKLFEQKIRNWNFLFYHIKRQFQGKIKFAIPLSCIIILKGLKVFCKSAVNCSQISSNLIQNVEVYLTPLQQLQISCKLSLHRCQLYQIYHNNTLFLYFNQLDALPKLGPDKAQMIDSNYISRYINSGVIRNQYDSQQMTKHIQNKLILKFVKYLDQSYVLSSLQLEEDLHIHGLNRSFIQKIYREAKEKGFKNAENILLSEILSGILQEYIRQSFHQLLSKKNACYDIKNIIFFIIGLWFKGDEKIQSIIIAKIRQKINKQMLIDQSHLSHQYILCSIMLKLGLKSDFKHRINIEQLQNIQFNWWKEYPYDQQHVNLFLTAVQIIYDYQNFNDSQFLRENIFKKRINLQLKVDRQTILYHINHNSHEPYHKSYLFKLLPALYKIKLNEFFAYITPPDNHRNLGLSFQYQYTQAYFNLYHHSTSYIPTYQSFAEDFIGIKWLIKKKYYEEAQSKLAELKQRAWMWAKSNPNILIQLYDLDFMYSVRMGKQNVAMQRSLVSLQLSIHYFGSEDNPNWQIMWEKAFDVGNMHYKMNMLQQAYEMYETCTDLIEKNKHLLKNLQINNEFLQIYNKKAYIQLNLGNVEESIRIALANIQKMKDWKTFFQKQAMFQASSFVKLSVEQFICYEMLFRCYEILNKHEDYQNLLRQCLIKYLQKDIRSPTFVESQIKPNQHSKQRFKTLTKLLWLFITNNETSINNKLKLRDLRPAKMIKIKDYLSLIRQQNHRYYRYTTQQMYKYIVELILRRKDQPIFKVDNKSVLFQGLIEALSQLSNSKETPRRVKLYEQQSSKSAIFLLESIAHIVGYEYAIGTICEELKCFDFEF